MEGVKNISDLIRIDPDYREGRPHIAGTGVSVAHVGSLWKWGYAAEEIAEEIPGISLVQTYAALACYHLNKELIDEDLVRQGEEYDRLAAEHQSRRTQPSLKQVG